MPSRCWILGCPSNLDKGKTRFFRFPHDEELKELWVNAIKRDVPPSDSSRICSKHFKPDDIIVTQSPKKELGEEEVISTRNLKLKAGAVPCIFEGLKPRRQRKKSVPVPKGSKSATKKPIEEALPSKNVDDKVPNLECIDLDTEETEKKVQNSPTTDKPIITVVKAQNSSAEKENRDEEVILAPPEKLKSPPEKLKSPIIKPNSRRIKNDLPSPYKHLPAVSVCLKEEDRIVLSKDESKSASRSPLRSGHNNNAEVSKTSSQPKRRKIEKPAPIVLGRQNDCYCWVCHRENTILCCIACPRAYHQKCAGELKETSDWVCPECEKILRAENVDTRSTVLSEISLDRLCALLRFCLNKMKHRGGVAFHQPVSLEHYPMYLHYVIHPMDFSLLEKNIKNKVYGCTEAFLADVKWILHNSCVFNGSQHPLSTHARTLVKSCENDMQEIEVCPDCYMHSVIRNKYWFADVCRKPHPLVWAKLKGFPYWPAKVVRIMDGNVDARFFGAHDRAWVPISQCYHLSKEMPTTSKPKKKGNYETALDELHVHAQLLGQKFGAFEYAPYRTFFDSKNKKLMYHGIDIDKITKNEITFDPSTTANSKDYCSSPVERKASTDSKMDVDQCDETSSNSLLFAPDTHMSRKASLEDEKEIAVQSKSNSEIKTPDITDNSKEDLKQPNLSSNSCDEPNLTNSAIPREKLELALERIKGYVSLENDDDKESSAKEDEPDEKEKAPVKDASISKEGTSSILAGLIKSKTLPKIDLPEIPVEEVETTAQEKASFLNLSKKNDTFTLHLLETIKRAKSRTAADEDTSENDIVTLDKEVSDSESAMEVDEDDDDEQDAEDENESDDQVSEEQKENVEHSASDDDEAADESDTESENESSSDTTDTDIEEIEVDESSDLTNKQPVKSTENINSEMSDKELEKSDDDSKSSKESDVLSPCEPKISDTDKDKSESSKNVENETLRKSPENKEKNSSVDDSIIKNVDGEAQKESDQNKDKPNNMNSEEDDEIIICPPVKPPTPPLICLDDGSDTEPENNDKIADESEKIVKSTKLPKFRTIGINKSSAVRVLRFSENELASKTRNKNSLSLPNTLAERNRAKRRILQSSSEDSSEDEYVPYEHDRGVPLSGARRTFNNLKKSKTSDTSSKTANDNAASESIPPVSNNVSHFAANEKASEKNNPAEVSAEIEPSLEPEISDGSPPENSARNIPITDKDAEILRLKKKLSCLFTAFQLQHWKHTQEKSELKHNMNLIVMEMRASLEADKKQSIENLSRSFERVKQRAIEEAKRNQWCASCLKEARYQCCWSTNYCSERCQRRNFLTHKSVCSQLKNTSNISTAISAKCVTPTASELKDNKKVFVVNMVPKDPKTSADQSTLGNVQQVTLTKSSFQVVPQKLTSSTHSPIPIAPKPTVKYILAPAKSIESIVPKQQPSKIAVQEEKTDNCDTSDIINNMKNKNCDMATAIYLITKKNQESETNIKKDEQKTVEPDLEEIYFPSPPQISFEGLDTATSDENLQLNTTENSEKNSSDTETLSQSEKTEASSGEEDLNFSDNDDADNELVTVGQGVQIKAKFLNKCLIYGKTAKRLTRCLVDVLFPDLTELALCSAFGQKSNVTKQTRGALPAKKVAAILEFVPKRFPSATRTEIVLAINMKCKEARNIVDKKDSDKPIKKNLFRRLLAKDKVDETKESCSPSIASTVISSSTTSTVTKSPVTTVTVMRQPVNQRICIKTPPATLYNVNDNLVSPTKLSTSPNIVKCPKVSLQPQFSSVTPTARLQPQLSRQTVRNLLSGSQPAIVNAAKEPRKILVPVEALKQCATTSPTSGSSQRPYIIIGAPLSSAQSLPVTQPSSLPTILRK